MSALEQKLDLKWSRFWDRLATVGLSAFLGLSGLSQLMKMNTALRDGDHVLALYQVLIGISSAIMAALVLVRGPKIASDSGWGPRIVATIGSFAVLPLAALPLTWDPAWLLAVTSAILIFSYVWIIWALLTLRRSFSVFPEARELITHGPYRFVRHPLYAAYFLTYTCVLLPRISLPAVIVLVVAISAEVMRSKNEERVLRSAFTDYDAYAAGVPAFFPFLTSGGRMTGLRPRRAAQASAPQG